MEQRQKMTETKWTRQPLRVSGRYFMEGDKPFFWLGDTAWLLFHRLNLEEAYQYLRNRKEFYKTLIQYKTDSKFFTALCNPQQNLYVDHMP